MDKLCISNLFGETKNDNLSIEELFDPIYSRPNVKFNVQQLIDVQTERENKKIDAYKRIFQKCLNKIEELHKRRITEFTYSVPLRIVGCPEYSTEECLEKIEDSLRELFMDTLIISRNTIFVTWYNIQENKLNKEKEKEDDNTSSESH